MANKDIILAIDIGTSGVKASLIQRQGQVLDSIYQGYPTQHRGKFVEQNPGDWWQAVIHSINALMQRHAEHPPQAVVMSGQMQNVILCSQEEHLAPAILYSDTRAAVEAKRVQEQIGEMRLRQVTGNLQDASSLLAKLLWVKEHWQEVYHNAQILFLGAHDYVTWRLCRAWVTDLTTASTTGLLNLNSNTWAVEFLTELGLRTDWLPELVSADQPTGFTSASLAEATGLPQGIPIFHGAGDAATTTLGARAGEAGRLYIYLGTSGWLATTELFAPADPLTGVFNLRHPDPRRLILIGPMLTAAGNLDWIREQFGDLERASRQDIHLDAYQLIGDLAAQAPPGSGGVLYLPYLAGERAPFRDANARGVFFGLHRSITRFHLYRAVLEGVALGMKTIYRVLPSTARQESHAGIGLVGGGARSRLWAQIFANVFNSHVQVLANPGDVGARGATLIAGKALGWYSDYDPPDFFPIQETCDPQPEIVEIYERAFDVFSELYPALKTCFQHLARAGSQ